MGNAVISNDDKKDLLAKLRDNYFDITAKEAELSAKFGPNNPTIVSLRNQKAQLRSEMRGSSTIEAIESRATTRPPNCESPK